VREDHREEPRLPRFALVHAGDQGECHALPPSAIAGVALCGAAPPDAGWNQGDQTTRLYLIDCHTCRQLAAGIVAAHSDEEADA
jgi:hypothetical protein